MASPGTAQVSLSFDAWKQGNVASSHHEVPVVAPKVVRDLAPVSTRLVKSLIHPSRSGTLVGLRFTPDGKRLIAGDYPGGVVVLWDVASGKQLAQIEAGYGYRPSSDYFCLSTNWRTLYVPREKRKTTRIEKGGKKMTRGDFSGDVRAWDLDTGQLQHTFTHTPPRGMGEMVLSPDGTTFATFEQLSGITERGWDHAATLWDVKTGQFRPLPGRLFYWSVYTPDSRILAAPADLGSGQSAIKLFDTATAREIGSIAVPEKNARIAYIAYSPDGKLLVGQVRDEAKSRRHWLRFWDPATGRTLASIEGEKGAFFIHMAFSPDGRLLIATDSVNEGRLALFDVQGKKLVRRLVLEKKAHVPAFVFSPDGKWLAALTQVIPEEMLRRDWVPEEMPQPHIHLIDTVSGAVRETLVAPQGTSVSACFSPDDKTLATSGNGRVLLWDLTKPALGADTGSK
jgi:WD40 repeat protein